MISEIIGLLKVGLSLWDSKEKTKYLDKVLRLERDWYEAYNAEDRNNALLDNIDFELRILAKAFCAEAGTKKT